MAENQAYLFVIFTFVGMIIGILFDFFIILRKTFKTKDIITYIEDIIFWIMTGIIIIHSMYKLCDGELRFFMIIGIVLGTAIYMLTISRYVNKNSTITFLAGGKFSENFEKIKILKNPAVFIFVYDEEDEKEIDKKNLEFIGKKENELGFEINKENKENYLKHIKEQLEEKLQNLDMLKERVDNLNSAIVKIKTIHK